MNCPRNRVNSNPVPLLTTTWEEWQSLHPGTEVLAPVAGFERFYRTVALEPLGQTSGCAAARRGRRWEATPSGVSRNTLGVGVHVGGEAAFFSYDYLADSDRRSAAVVLAGEPVLILFDDGGTARTATAFLALLGDDVVDVASVEAVHGVFRLTNGMEIDLAGRVLDGAGAVANDLGLLPLEGSLTTRWYGWVASYPGTQMF